MNQATLFPVDTVMRAPLLVTLLLAAVSFAKPSDKCSKTCEEAMGKISAGCRKNANNGKGNPKERAEEGRVCLDSISTMRTACLKQCTKSQAKEAEKH